MKKISLFFIFILFLLACPAYALSIDVDTPKTITADKIEYDLKTETIKTSGDTEIVNSTGQRMTLTDSYLSKDGSSLTGDDIKLWLGSHVYIESDNIIREEDETIALNATFTACDDCDAYGDAWKISTQKIVHDMNDKDAVQSALFLKIIAHGFDHIAVRAVFRQTVPHNQNGAAFLIRLFQKSRFFNAVALALVFGTNFHGSCRFHRIKQSSVRVFGRVFIF